MIKDICRNLTAAAKSVENIDYTVVLRGDSTLRGHFPEARTAALNQYYNNVNIFAAFFFELHHDMSLSDLCRKHMQQFRYLVRWMHGSFALSFFKEAVILSKMCTM